MLFLHFVMYLFFAQVVVYYADENRMCIYNVYVLSKWLC